MILVLVKKYYRYSFYYYLNRKKIILRDDDVLCLLQVILVKMSIVSSYLVKFGVNMTLTWYKCYVIVFLEFVKKLLDKYVFFVLLKFKANVFFWRYLSAKLTSLLLNRMCIVLT